MIRLQFTSALLRRMPATRRNHHLARKLIRAVLLLLLAVSSATIAIGVQMRAFDLQSASWVYRAHDDLWLPFVGYTFRLFFPWSILAYGLLATILGWYALMWVTQSAPLRYLQRRLLRRAVRNPARHPRLLRTARRFAWFRLRPHLLALVAEDEYAQAPSSALLGLRLDLWTCFSLDHAALLHLLADWQDLAADTDDAAALSALLDRFSPLRGLGDPDALFSVAGLFADVERAFRWQQSRPQPDIHLLNRQSARRDRLNEVYQYLHQTLYNVAPSQAVSLPAIENPQWLAPAGSAALRLAREVSLLTGDDTHLRAYRAASERLALLADIVPSPTARAWAALLGGAARDGQPVTLDLARMHKAGLRRELAAWSDERGSDERRLLSSAARDMAHRQRVRAAVVAAFPAVPEPAAERN